MSVSTMRSSPSLISPMATPATGLDRHAGGHQRHGGGAHGAHRGGPVRLERLRDHPYHVGEVLLARDRGRQSALGERPVADVAALRAAHEARLPDRERREVVVVPEGLRLLQAEVVDPHVHAARPERDVGQDLGLAASEQGGSVDARRDVDLALDRPDLVRGPPVGPLLVDRDAAADDLLLEPVEGARDLGPALGIGVLSVRRRLRTARGPAPRPLSASCRASFSWICVASSSCAPCEARISSTGAGSSLGGSTSSFSLPALSWSSERAAQISLISLCAMSSASRTSASVTPWAPHSTIRIASCDPETTRSISRSS